MKVLCSLYCTVHALTFGIRKDFTVFGDLRKIISEEKVMQNWNFELFPCLSLWNQNQHIFLEAAAHHSRSPQKDWVFPRKTLLNFFLTFLKNINIYSKISHCSPSYEVDIKRCPFSLKKKKVWALAELVNWVSFLTSRLTAPLSKLSLIFRPFFQNGTTFRQARFCCGIASRCTHKLN